MTRPIYEIAKEIRKDWKNVHYTAVPYLKSMLELTNITDMDMHDDAQGIILRFLGNATSWRGEVARRIKQELKEMVK